MNSTNDERKLWFDYLLRLNDRDLQRARASGATSWLLITAVAAIAYKGLPQLPAICNKPDALRSSLAVFTLEANATIPFGVFLWCIRALCMDPGERRLMPIRTRRSEFVLVWSLALVFVALTVVNALAFFIIDGPWFLRWTTAVFALFWIVDVVLTLRARQLANRREKERNVPKFTPELNTKLFISLMCAIRLPLFVVLVAYMYFLAKTMTGWLLPLSVATQVLAALLIVLGLFRRTIKASSASFYEQLERAILVESLDSSQIKLRFVENILGKSLSDWLNVLESEIQASEEQLRVFVESVKGRFKDIESLDPNHHFERSGQGRHLAEELERKMMETTKRIESLQERLTACGSTCEDNELLSNLREMLQRTKALDNKRKAAGELLREISAFVTNEREVLARVPD